MRHSRLIILTGICVMAARCSSGDVITPTQVKATTEFGVQDVFGDGSLISMVFVESLIDGSGLVGGGSVETQLHDFNANAETMWHAGDDDAGIPGGEDGDADPFTPPPVDEQIVEFDLGGPHALTSALVWQMNQGGVFGALAPNRGVNEMEILVSLLALGDNFTSVGLFNLEVEEGIEDVPAQVLSLDQNGMAPAVSARRVRFNI